MKKTTYTLVFNYNNKLNADGTGTIYLYIYNPNFRKRISTGIKVLPIYWNEKKKEVVKHPSAHIYNDLIKNIIRKIEEAEYNSIINQVKFTKEVLQELLNSVFSGTSEIAEEDSEENSFVNFIFKEKSIDKGLSPATIKQHNCTYNALKDFNDKAALDKIDYEFAQSFDTYLRKTKGLGQNTIHKHHKIVRKFLKIAVLKKLCSPTSYGEFKSVEKESLRTSLKFEELERLEELSTRLPELTYAKDLFLFSCYCGLRFSDVETLAYSHLNFSESGITIIKPMNKVDKTITLPLFLLFSGKPEAIIKKYIVEGKSKNDLIFKKISNQYINRSLKILSELARINTRLTFHVSRHTFGTMLAELTQNPYLIMDLMGHADIQTSMIYIHRSQERINKQLRNVSWKL